MDCKYYERKINDVIMKCPIEIGVEILIYNVNGLVWKYYLNQNLKWEISISRIENKACEWHDVDKPVYIDSDKFKKLIDNLKEINWTDNTEN